MLVHSLLSLRNACRKSSRLRRHVRYSRSDGDICQITNGMISRITNTTTGKIMMESYLAHVALPEIE